MLIISLYHTKKLHCMYNILALKVNVKFNVMSKLRINDINCYDRHSPLTHNSAFLLFISHACHTSSPNHALSALWDVGFDQKECPGFPDYRVCLQILLILTHLTVQVNQTLTSSLGSTPDFQNKSPTLLQNKSPFFFFK